jgi:hypothetical protein
MRPGAKITDRELLDRLLRSGKLTPTQTRIFGGWYDQLTTRALAELPPRDRLWADAVYQDRGVGALRAAARRKTRTVEQAKAAPFLFETMPRPKRPPGR